MEKLTTSIMLQLTAQEREVWGQIVTAAGGTHRNVLRHAISSYAKQIGLAVPDGAFASRRMGNYRKENKNDPNAAETAQGRLL